MSVGDIAEDYSSSRSDRSHSRLLLYHSLTTLKNTVYH